MRAGGGETQAARPTPFMPLVFRPLVCLPAQELHDLGQAIYFFQIQFSLLKKLRWNDKVTSEILCNSVAGGCHFRSQKTPD